MSDASITSSIPRSLEQIRSQIAGAAERSGRDAKSVRLIAVSKVQPVESIVAAYQAGQRDFGENYAQELREKSSALTQTDLQWHFLGALQSNKARVVVGRAALIHTCDRLSLAEELNKRATALGAVQRVLVEVNLAAEAQKGGCDPKHLRELFSGLSQLPHVRCEGLMCIPKAGQDPRPHFRALARLREEANYGAWYPHTIEELSMGMSADFAVAIEEGATLVRVGTAIFGERKGPPAKPA